MTTEYCKMYDFYTAYYLDEACAILHRGNDLPAVIYDDGAQYWFQNGKYHRETGPAVIYPDGRKYYYLNGICYSKEEFYIKIGKSHLLTFI